MVLPWQQKDVGSSGPSRKQGLTLTYWILTCSFALISDHKTVSRESDGLFWVRWLWKQKLLQFKRKIPFLSQSCHFLSLVTVWLSFYSTPSILLKGASLGNLRVFSNFICSAFDLKQKIKCEANSKLKWLNPAAVFHLETQKSSE